MSDSIQHSYRCELIYAYLLWNIAINLLWVVWSWKTSLWKTCHLEANLPNCLIIRYTKAQNLNVSRLILQLSLRNLLKPGVRLKMKTKLEQSRQALLQLHLNDRHFCCQLRCAYIRDLTIFLESVPVLVDAIWLVKMVSQLGDER